MYVADMRIAHEKMFTWSLLVKHLGMLTSSLWVERDDELDSLAKGRVAWRMPRALRH